MELSEFLNVSFCVSLIVASKIINEIIKKYSKYKYDKRIVVFVVGVILGFCWIHFVYNDCIGECIGIIISSFFIAVGFHSYLLKALSKKLDSNEGGDGNVDESNHDETNTGGTNIASIVILLILSIGLSSCRTPKEKFYRLEGKMEKLLDKHPELANSLPVSKIDTVYIKGSDIVIHDTISRYDSTGVDSVLSILDSCNSSNSKKIKDVIKTYIKEKGCMSDTLTKDYSDSLVSIHVKMWQDKSGNLIVDIKRDEIKIPFKYKTIDINCPEERCDSFAEKIMHWVIFLIIGLGIGLFIRR